MLSAELAERERVAIANLQSTLRYQALAHDAFSSLAVVQLVNGSLATGATLGLCIYQYWASGPQRLLLFALVRLALLLLVGLFAYKAFCQRAPSFLGIQRPTLYRVAVYLQLLWFCSELLLGSAFLVFLPLLQGSSDLGPEALQNNRLANSLVVKVIPLCYMVGMAGCLCFITHFKNRRRFGKGSRGPLCPSSSSCYVDTDSEGGYLPGPPITSAGGPAPPTVTCEIVLMEHLLDTNESVLFVHKKLRPIKTRPDDRAGTYISMLKPVIQTCSKPSVPPPAQQQQPQKQQQQQRSQQPHRQAPPPPLISLTSFPASSQQQQPQQPGGTTQQYQQQYQQQSCSSGSSTQSVSFTTLCHQRSAAGYHHQPLQQQQRQCGSGSASSCRSGSEGGSSGARSIVGLGVA